MKPTIINHPLREIHLSYNSDAAISPFEAEALTKYQLMHNEVYAMKNEWPKVQAEIAERVKEYELLNAELDKLEEEIKHYRELAGYTAEEVESFHLPDKYELKFDDLEEQSNQYQEMVDEQWPGVNKTKKAFDELNQRYEQLDQEFEAYCTDYFSPIIRNYAEMEIDTVSFDNDFDRFREEMEKLYQQQQLVVEDLNNWVEQLDGLTKRTSELIKRRDTIYDNMNPVSLLQKNTGGKFSDN